MGKCNFRNNCELFTNESIYCMNGVECQCCGIWKRFNRGEIKQYKKVIN